MITKVRETYSEFKENSNIQYNKSIELMDTEVKNFLKDLITIVNTSNSFNENEENGLKYVKENKKTTEELGYLADIADSLCNYVCFKRSQYQI